MEDAGRQPMREPYRGSMVPPAEPAPVEYPHSYYPFPKGCQMAMPMADPTMRTSFVGMRRKGKGPFYAGAMRELGGVEDKLGGTSGV